MRQVRGCGWLLVGVLSGCVAPLGGGGDKPSVAIKSVSVAPATVADGATFNVTWDVSYNNGQGIFTEMGLYMGAAADLATADARDQRSLFSLADTGGAPSRPPTIMACTRTGPQVRCAHVSALSRAVSAGDTVLTFRLCSSNVLDSKSEVCDTRAVSMTFP